MKKQIFDLETILVREGLVFLLTHKEISAESDSNKPEAFARSQSLLHVK